MFSRNLLLSALITTTLAQSDPLATVSQALISNGFTSFASLLPTLNQSTVGQGLFKTLLSGGNFSLFIPDNGAISRVPQSVASNADLLSNIVSYHVLRGNFTDPAGGVLSGSLPNVTIGRTLLNDSSLVNLEGNRSQVLVFGKESNGTVRILNQPSTVTVTNTTSVLGFGIYGINEVLTVPGSPISALAASLGSTDSALTGLLNNTSITGADGSNVSFTNYLDSNAVRGFTFFAPNNAALAAAASALAGLQGNATAVQIVLGNHIINGSTVYSTSLANSTSASGEPLTFFTNSSGTYVSSGNVATAKIVATNILARNGVLHVIDSVLANTQSDPSAAQSAFNAATSTASQTSADNGPLATGTSGGGSGGNSGGKGNGVPSQNLVPSYFIALATIACAGLTL